MIVRRKFLPRYKTKNLKGQVLTEIKRLKFFMSDFYLQPEKILLRNTGFEPSLKK